MRPRVISGGIFAIAHLVLIGFVAFSSVETQRHNSTGYGEAWQWAGLVDLPVYFSVVIPVVWLVTTIAPSYELPALLSSFAVAGTLQWFIVGYAIARRRV